MDRTDGTRSRERLAEWFEKNSEGLWRIDLLNPLPHEKREDLAEEHILTHGTLAECNTAMACILQEVGCADPVGMPLISSPFFVPVVHALVQAEFNLIEWEFAKTSSFKGCVVNATGIFENDSLVRIWGRCKKDLVEGDLEIRLMNALEEQQREIGYELHDGLGQLLIAARLVSYNIAELVGASEDEVRVQCNHLSNLTDQALVLLQRITQELTPREFLNGNSLNDALETLAHTTNRFLDVYCTYTYDEEAESVDSEKQIHIYRIVQEAVNNAVKHAQARNVNISLRRLTTGVLQFAVIDDGIGFNKEEKGKNSLGLKSMVHRARLIGARLEIESIPGKSTAIQLTVPSDVRPEGLNKESTRQIYSESNDSFD